ncbi:hypothetical protein M885DRAFT_525279 [Pelagophyceae sp. CCMP2097]|nr:hypothetical protein M885DRAFT_525279 [Pelagophyceae sp. CCMP2097]
MSTSLSREVVFECGPDDPESYPNAFIAVSPVARVENVETAPNDLNQAFAYFDAATLDEGRRTAPRRVRGAPAGAYEAPREFYEAPRVKLARLQREADEVRLELVSEPEAYDGDDGANLMHQVEALRLSLERVAAGLPAAPAARASPSPDATNARAVSQAALLAVEQRRAVLPEAASWSDVSVSCLGGGSATMEVLDRGVFLDECSGDDSLKPLVARLAALRGLHELGFEFAKRLRATELEQAQLLMVMQSNDQALKRIAESLKHLEA